MTYYDYHDQGIWIAREAMPQLQIDARRTLSYISDALIQIEQASGAIKMLTTVTLDPASTTGKYTAPVNIATMDTVTWQPDINTPGFWPVEFWTPDRWKEEFTAEQISPPGQVPILLPPDGGTIFTMLEFGTLNVLPLGISGVLAIRYKPQLTLYAASDPLWSTFGAAPEAAMRANSPDIAAVGAQRGILRYVAAQMLRAQPDGFNRFRAEILNHELEFRKSVGIVMRDAVEPVLSTPVKLSPPGGMW